MENKLIVDSKLTDRDDSGYIYWQGKLFTGTENWYYDDDNIGTETEYVDGVPDGVMRGWYRNGKIRSEKFYIKGRIQGYVREWYESGQIKREEEIYNGIALSTKQWDENGNLIVDKRKN